MTKNKSSIQLGHGGLAIVPAHQAEATWIGGQLGIGRFGGRKDILSGNEIRSIEDFVSVSGESYLGIEHFDYVLPMKADQGQVNRLEAPFIGRNDVRMVFDDDDFAAVQKVFLDISNKNRKRIQSINNSDSHGMEGSHVLESPAVQADMNLMVPLRDISALFIFVFLGLLASSLFGGKQYIHPVAGFLSIVFLFSLIFMDFVYKNNSTKKGV